MVHSSESEHFFTSFEALKYDVARLRSYTSNSSLLGPTGAQSAYLQTLQSSPNATDSTRRVAAQLQTALTTQNTRRRCGFYKRVRASLPLRLGHTTGQHALITTMANEI